MVKENLINKIKEASKAYYETSNPIMSDDEFDSLIEKLKLIDPNNPILTSVNWGVEININSVKRKVRHSTPMLGIPDKRKIKNVKESDYPNEPCLVSLKCDGVSARIYFDKDLNIDKILTRGDGEYGVDITDLIKPLLYNNSEKPEILLKQYYGNKNITSIRCELVILRNDFKECYGYPTPLSMVVGLINSNNPDPELVKLVSIIPFEVKADPDFDLLSKYIFLDQLNIYGFNFTKNLFFYCATMIKPTRDMVIEMVKELDSKRYTTSIPNDGCVLLTQNKQFAIKFEDERYTAIVEKVSPQVSLQGKIVPVIIFKEPVKINGTNITKCSGFNYKKIIEDRIGKGSIIEIIKANQVIPHWVKTIRTAPYPDLPHNHSEEYKNAYWKGVDLYIDVDKEKLSVFSLLNINSVHGISDISIKNIMDNLDINTHEKLYSFVNGNYTVNSYVGVTKVAINKFENTLYNLSNNLSIGMIFKCLNVQCIGDVTCSVLEDYFTKNKDELFSFTKIDPNKIPGLVNKNIAPALKENAEFIERVFCIWKDKIRYKEYDKQQDQLKVCLTGSYKISRKEFVSKYSLKEVTVASADIVIYSERETSSSKYKQALRQNKRLLTYEQFIEEWNSKHEIL